MSLLRDVFHHPLYHEGMVGDAIQAPEDGEPEETALGYELATAHAPAGGVEIAGQHFDGGEFIPKEVLAKASPEEKAKLAGAASGGTATPGKSAVKRPPGEPPPENLLHAYDGPDGHISIFLVQGDWNGHPVYRWEAWDEEGGIEDAGDWLQSRQEALAGAEKHAGERGGPEVQDEGTSPPRNPRPSSPLAESLERSPVRVKRGLTGGCNVTTLLKLEDGTQGVFKPSAGEKAKLRRGVASGTYYQREVAASRLADVLGFGDLVPATVFRKEGKLEGSMQAYVPDAESANGLVTGAMYDGPEDTARAAVFDYLIGHLDRYAGNWLVKGLPPKLDPLEYPDPKEYYQAFQQWAGHGKLVLIDNGLSFPVEYHAEDFFNFRFWTRASQVDLPMPDGSHFKDKWPTLEAALKECGLGEKAIALTKKRFEAVASGKHKKVGDLPHPFREGKTLADLARTG